MLQLASIAILIFFDPEFLLKLQNDLEETGTHVGIVNLL